MYLTILQNCDKSIGRFEVADTRRGNRNKQYNVNEQTQLVNPFL